MRERRFHNHVRVACIVSIVAGLAIVFPAAPSSAQFVQQSAVVQSADYLTPEELEGLLAPIALYPDVLLAQVLTAATYPLDVVQAARWLRTRPDLSRVLDQPWDPSVLSLCNYPEIIFRLDDDIEWTNAVGLAFLNQRGEVMDAIQYLRRTAQVSGALRSTPEQTVLIEESVVRIVPAQPRVVYVPRYDPQIIYVERRAPAYSSVVSFGAGALGAWLDLDFEWRQRDVVWCRPGQWHGWRHRDSVHYGDRWITVTGPRRGFPDHAHRGHGFGGHWDRDGHGPAWRRHGHAPPPAYIGRFRDRDSRRQSLTVIHQHHAPRSPLGELLDFGRSWIEDRDHRRDHHGRGDHRAHDRGRSGRDDARDGARGRDNRRHDGRDDRHRGDHDDRRRGDDDDRRRSDRDDRKD